MTRDEIKRLSMEELEEKRAIASPGSTAYEALDAELQIRLRKEQSRFDRSTRRIAIAALVVGLLNAVATVWPYLAASLSKGAMK